MRVDQSTRVIPEAGARKGGGCPGPILASLRLGEAGRNVDVTEWVPDKPSLRSGFPG